MAAEDYIDDIDFYDEMAWATSDDYPNGSKYPADFPCRKCRYSKNYKCTRRRGIDICPSAAWFKEHNKGE